MDDYRRSMDRYWELLYWLKVLTCAVLAAFLVSGIIQESPIRMAVAGVSLLCLGANLAATPTKGKHRRIEHE